MFQEEISNLNKSFNSNRKLDLNKRKNSFPTLCHLFLIPPKKNVFGIVLSMQCNGEEKHLYLTFLFIKTNPHVNFKQGILDDYLSWYSLYPEIGLLLIFIELITAWKVFVFGVFLVRIFPHSYWIRRYTERYSVFLCIQSESGKIRTKKTPNTDTFYALNIATFLGGSLEIVAPKAKYI